MPFLLSSLRYVEELAQGARLFEAANEPKQFVTIPGGDHNDPQSDDYHRALDAFLASLPASSSLPPPRGFAPMER